MKRISVIVMSVCIIVCFAHAQIYSLGDIIEIAGHKAIVFEIDDSGQHGKAMSVKALRGVKNAWCNNNKHVKRLPSLVNREDGQDNTAKILGYISRNDAAYSFPAFAWCKRLGPDWYIPSIGEVEAFVGFWLGNNRTLDWDEDVDNTITDSGDYYKTINNELLDAGGSAFFNGVYSSTLDGDGKVYIFQFNRNKGSWKFVRKPVAKLGEDCVGRAFIKF